MTFELVDTNVEYANIETMASIIWPHTYRGIVSNEQIKYMLKQNLSVDAIKESVKAGMTYIIMKNNNVPVGFMAYKFSGNELFLSKLYILPNYQHKGYAKEAIKYLKAFNLPITLRVNKMNKNAIAAYLALGFKNVKSDVCDIGNGFVMDDYIMLLKK